MTDSTTVIAHAFPHIEQRDGYNVYHPGLTKREYFAAMAMQGLLSAPTDTLRLPSNVCSSALLFADELIDQLAK
jgi:hypothetical protein